MTYEICPNEAKGLREPFVERLPNAQSGRWTPMCWINELEADVTP
jgi:hypothetical protein